MPRRSIDLVEHEMLALSRSAFATLRSALLRDADIAGATYLQEAGFAGSDAVFTSFRQWLRGRMDAEPGELSLDEFADMASEYFESTGWGSLRIGSLQDAVATVDSENWAEADPGAALDQPGCHLTTGMLAGFFGQLSDAPLAVLEVECRSTGAPRCRFLLGAADVMGRVYDDVERGVSYEEAVAAVA